MSLTIKKEGILTTVQDLGRVSYRRFGVNPGGVMDRAAVRLINALLANDENAAVLEVHFPAGEIRFDRDASFALGGADFGPTLNGEPISNWRMVFAAKDSLLRFPSKTSGERTYLAVRGGFDVPEWLKSRSTNLGAAYGGFEGRRLRSGDVVGVCEPPDEIDVLRSSISPSLIPHYGRFPTVRVVRGGDFERLTASSQNVFRRENFVISKDSNRMGFRLRGEPLQQDRPEEMISSAVTFGTIQLLPDGQLIALMADQQTAGGYPRIAQVIERDLPLLAQLGPNDKVAFHEVDLSHAEELATEFERDITILRVGVQLQMAPSKV